MAAAGGFGIGSASATDEGSRDEPDMYQQTALATESLTSTTVSCRRSSVSAYGDADASSIAQTIP